MTEFCITGEVIKCGSRIRLEHMNTGKNLHSHSGFDSPVSRRQEVSAFGDNGDGDGGDNWIVECEGEYLYGKTHFYMKHLDTGKYLYTDYSSKYTESNCRRCPIIGHSEISSANGKTKNAIWKIHSGFFFPQNTEKAKRVDDYDYGDDDDEDVDRSRDYHDEF
jgi:dolichyl-phosphate-mannose--protein O-mannosyl transferase